jgi:Flp pilus assembly protein TadG
MRTRPDSSTTSGGRARRAVPFGLGQRDADKGALAVEAALVFPFLALLLFGIIEWGLVLRDQVEVVSVARSGARTASSLAPYQRPYVAPAEAMTLTTTKSVESAASALPKNSIDFILVYQANASGLPLSGSYTCVGAETTCDRYTWDDVNGKFSPTTGTTWTGSTVNSCQGDPGVMSVGVYVQATHKMLTGLFGGTKTVKSATVMQFEPQRPGHCKP